MRTAILEFRNKLYLNLFVPTKQMYSVSRYHKKLVTYAGKDQCSHCVKIQQQQEIRLQIPLILFLYAERQTFLTEGGGREPAAATGRAGGAAAAEF